MHHNHLFEGRSSEELDWMRQHGLCYHGRMPENWKPKPRNLKAWWFFMTKLWWKHTKVRLARRFHAAAQ